MSTVTSYSSEPLTFAATLPAAICEIDDRPAAHVAAAAVEPVRVVAVALEVVAPRLAPERRRDRPPGDRDRRHRFAPPRRILRQARRVGAPRPPRTCAVQTTDNPSSSLVLSQCLSQIESHERHQLVVVSSVSFASPVPSRISSRQLPLGLDQRVDLLLDGAAADELVHEHVPASGRCETRDPSPGSRPRGSTSDRSGSTCDAAVRLRPVPPALSESTKNGTARRPGTARPARCASSTGVSPCSTRPARPNTPAEKRGERRADLAELREDEHLLLLRRDRLGELAQARELAAVGLGASRRRPSHCDGWLQICLSRMSDASTRRAAAMPSAAAQRAASSSTACS